MKGQLTHEVITLLAAHKDTSSNFTGVQRTSSFPKRLGLTERPWETSKIIKKLWKNVWKIEISLDKKSHRAQFYNMQRPLQKSSEHSALLC